jgi:cytidine deaminase
VSDKELLTVAAKARGNAYVPYSKFAVGAALVGKSGKVFTGCNVENVSLGLTMCAERVALGAAVSSGETEFVAIAIVVDSKRPAIPCGACRQVLAEFNPTLKIVTSSTSGERETLNLADLLPKAKQGILESYQDV